MKTRRRPRGPDYEGEGIRSTIKNLVAIILFL